MLRCGASSITSDQYFKTDLDLVAITQPASPSLQNRHLHALATKIVHYDHHFLIQPQATFLTPAPLPPLKDPALTLPFDPVRFLNTKKLEDPGLLSGGREYAPKEICTSNRLHHKERVFRKQTRDKKKLDHPRKPNQIIQRTHTK